MEEVVIKKSYQCTNTSRYPYGYEVVCGKRHTIIKQAEILPVGTHELSHVQQQENHHEQEQECTYAEAVHKVLVAGSDTLSLIFENIPHLYSSKNI